MVSLFLALLAGNVHASGITRVLTTSCSALVPSANMLFKDLGTVLFTCGPNPALRVNMSGSATPGFQLPKGYIVLMIVHHVSGSQKCGLGIILLPGHTTSFPTIGNFDYCALYFGPPGTVLAAFALSWSQSSTERE
ncbi:MAG TPA: hypothetical protein VGS11_01045 [Candidatus Bathyarchaeia archaeon]|nr:hypothetical protein [Candidatus Bathyarchaeia archaeon]